MATTKRNVFMVTVGQALMERVVRILRECPDVEVEMQHQGPVEADILIATCLIKEQVQDLVWNADEHALQMCAVEVRPVVD